MIGQLVVFNAPTQCFDDTIATSSSIPGTIWIEPGNIGILVSKYLAGPPTNELMYCEVLIGDRIVSDVDLTYIDPVKLGENNAG